MDAIKADLTAHGLSVKVDDRDTLRPGFKFAEWELKGVPVRLAIGPRDLASNEVEMTTRYDMQKGQVSQDGLAERLVALMDEIQKNMYAKALKFRDEHIFKVDTWEEFQKKIEEGGFLLCPWDGTTETEQKIQDLTKATIRCIPIDSCVCEEEGVDMLTGKPSHRRVVFARAY
jgi:prolyl-tRNA synthetase